MSYEIGKQGVQASSPVPDSQASLASATTAAAALRDAEPLPSYCSLLQPQHHEKPWGGNLNQGKSHPLLPLP